MTNAEDWGDEDFDLAPTRLSTPQDTPKDFPDYIHDSVDQYALYIHDVVINGVRQYANHDPVNEVGGVLYGRHYQRGGTTVVIVSRHHPLPSNSSSAMHFDFDEKA